jgi:hypothetical protein
MSVGSGVYAQLLFTWQKPEQKARIRFPVLRQSALISLSFLQLSILFPHPARVTLPVFGFSLVRLRASYASGEGRLVLRLPIMPFC